MYAHARIELRHEDGSVTWVERGDEVDPGDVVGGDELVEAGSIREEEYDPAADVSPAPDVVEIDGVQYMKATDGAVGSEDVNA